MLGKGSLEKLLTYYPEIETGEGRKKKKEYTNRHNVMYMAPMSTTEEHQAVRLATFLYFFHRVLLQRPIEE